MSDAPITVDTESWDPFRVITVLSAVLIGMGYFLPWANIDGPAQQIENGGAVVNLSNEGFEGSVSASDISLFPEIVVAVAFLAILVTVLRWTLLGQFFVGLAGLGAAYLVLLLWAVIDADGQGELVQIGSYAGLPSSFGPAVGLWITMAGTLALVFCGFGAATGEYVRRKEAEG